MLDGEERTGINLQLRPAAATTIQGRVVPLPGRRIGNSSEVRLRLPGAPLDLFEHRTWIQPDNTFRILGVVVGSYLLEVELQEAVSCDVISHNSEDILTEMSLEVPPAGLNDVVVPIAAGAKMTGRLRFDGKTSRPESIDTWLTPVLRSDRGDTRLGAWHDGGQILIDGLIPGDYVLGVSQDKTGWFIRSMTWNGFDLAVRPLAMDHDDVSGVEVTMTDRPSPVEGRIVDATGNVVGDATVIVFPFDRASWPTAHDQLAGFERQRSLDGTYRFEHLVPGNYFIAAVDERRMSDWPRTQFLEAIAKQASPVRIAPGELRTLNLTIKGR